MVQQWGQEWPQLSPIVLWESLKGKHYLFFRKHHSTAYALACLYDKISSAIENKEYTVGIFIDLSKAFDTVDHHILISKLEHCGVPDTALRWFEGYVNKPFLWLRYIDDILMVWTHGNEKLDSFIAYLNSIHPTIKFTGERSTTSIPFLDVKIFLENGKIETDLYCKPTDKNQNLLHSSSHPYHTKKSIPYIPDQLN